MINVNDIVAIGGVLVGVTGGIYGLAPYFKKKNINTEKVLDTTQNVLEAAEPLIQVAKGIPSLRAGATLVDLIQDKAISAAKIAEQLDHAGQLQGNEEKFDYARNTVYAVLKEIGVEPTDNQKKLIDDFIQEGVNDLGHATPTEAEKNAQIAKAQQDLAAVNEENAQLKQTIASIQSTVGNTTTPTQDTTATVQSAIVQK